MNELMAMPAPPPMMPPMPMPMQSPNTGKVRTGLLIAGIGLLLGAFVGFGGFGFIGGLIFVVGGAIMLGGLKSYPNARGMALAGFGLALGGFVLSLVAWVMTPSLFLLVAPTDPIAYLNAVVTGLLIGFVASLLLWIGVILMGMKLMTGSAKGLAIAGGVLGLLGAIIFLAMVYTAFAAMLAAVAGGGTFDVNTLIAAAIGILLGALMSFIGSLLAGIGYIIGRNKIVPATM
ncbi:MAG TPA: hypothetical protein VGR51_01125 [Thermoplasmata archaeon]|nr:hypothetical protein [Thermoplasmata archaeon]